MLGINIHLGRVYQWAWLGRYTERERREGETRRRTSLRCSATSARIWSLYGNALGMPGSFLCSAHDAAHQHSARPHARREPGRGENDRRTALPLRVLLRLFGLLPAGLLHLVLDPLALVERRPPARLCARRRSGVVAEIKRACTHSCVSEAW